jgi:hypothetical protein
MEPMDDPQLKKLLSEWQVENAPPSLDQRVLPVRLPWWRALLSGSVRVPVPVLVGFAVLFVAMTAALLRPQVAPSVPAASTGFNLADFQPVQDAQVRIIRSGNAN